MTLPIHETVAAFRAACDTIRASGQRLGLVPTMGALHEGHLALIREAQRHAEQVAVTIFVNPTQFGPNEDLARYPRDLPGDAAKCASAGAALVFAPKVEEMYPAGERTRVAVRELTTALCGASRPGHFDGVTTIVTKLFAVAGPCVAVFGKKDYQQLTVVRRMTRDLLLPVEIVAHPTVREADGLAMSSRNAYLTPDQRARAVALPRALAAAHARFAAGERRAGALLGEVEQRLRAAGFRIDYVALADAEALTLVSPGSELEGTHVLAVAAYQGSTRLIDNLVLGEDPAPVVTAEAP